MILTFVPRPTSLNCLTPTWVESGAELDDRYADIDRAPRYGSSSDVSWQGLGTVLVLDWSFSLSLSLFRTPLSEIVIHNCLPRGGLA